MKTAAEKDRSFQTIIFDFDYTLADSSRGAVKCINGALCEMGLPEAAPEDICRAIGLSLTHIFIKLTGRKSTAENQEFGKLFVQLADAYMADLTVLYPMVPPVMLFLKDRGKKLGIVSTKYRRRIHGILKRENLDHLFDVIIGGEDVAVHKPDPSGLLKAMEVLQTLPAMTLYVGDSIVDAETAQRAGVPFMAILSGMTERGAFDGYPIIGAVENLSQLGTWLRIE